MRSVAEILELFERCGLSSLQPETDALQRRPDEAGLRQFLAALLRLDATRVARVLEQAGRSVARLESDPVFAWMGRLLELHPHDIGALSTLFLRLLRLEPGEALFQPPGMLHCYLEGAAVEVMADSDNVVRAALTTKKVDVAEMLRLLLIEPPGSEPVEACQKEPGLWSYAPPVAEFNLSRLCLEKDGRFVSQGDRAIEVWVCTEGEGQMKDRQGRFLLSFRAGESMLVPAVVQEYSIEGKASLFLASVPARP